MLFVLKSTVSVRRSFEHPKHMLKLIGKKIFTIFTNFNINLSEIKLILW